MKKPPQLAQVMLMTRMLSKRSEMLPLGQKLVDRQKQ